MSTEMAMKVLHDMFTTSQVLSGQDVLNALANGNVIYGSLVTGPGPNDSHAVVITGIKEDGTLTGYNPENGKFVEFPPDSEFTVNTYEILSFTDAYSEYFDRWNDSQSDRSHENRDFDQGENWDTP